MAVAFKKCLWCDDDYDSNVGTPYHIEGFCSQECYDAFKEVQIETSVPVKPQHTKICAICGSMYIGKEEFCSAECSIPYCEERGIWYQRVKLKRRNPYCKKFNDDLKKRVRAYFGNCCVLCGKTEEENGKALSIHHVNYDKKAGCNGKRVMLVPLCKNCHAEVHGEDEYYERYFQKMIETEYNSKCYVSKKEYKLMKDSEIVRDLKERSKREYHFEEFEGY
jgi:hypothetical protein